MAYYFSPFRKQYTATDQPKQGCPFCDTAVLESQTIRRADGTPFMNEHYRFVVNAFPKFEGHTMLIPHEHLVRLADETPASVLGRHELLLEALEVMEQKFPNCGIEYFIQTGSGSAGSVPHLHWHLVPAHPDDELRSFEKLGHFYTTHPDEEKVVIFPKTITMDPDSLLEFLSSNT